MKEIIIIWSMSSETTFQGNLALFVEAFLSETQGLDKDHNYLI